MDILWEEEDLDQWMSSVDLAKKYQVDRRRLERLAKNGTIEIKKGPHPILGNKQLVNYYRVPSSTIRVTTKLGPTSPSTIGVLASELKELPHLEDLTNIVEKTGGVQTYLDAVDKAKNLTYLVKRPAAASSQYTKILTLSDLHFPFQNQELIDEIVEEHSDADILVLNGDLLDGYAASSFGKNKTVPMHLEYTMGLDFVFKMSKLFPQVYLVRGNHEVRVERYMTSRLDPNMSMFGIKDALSYLASGYVFDKDGNPKGILNMDNVFYNLTGNPWILQLNKTVFLHPNCFTSGPFKTVMSACDYLQNFLDWGSYDSVVMGHTHQLGKTVYRGKLLMEQGCLVKVMDYNRNGKFTKTPSTLGYAVIYQDSDGNTLFNDSNVFYSGTLNYLKE